MKLQKQKTDYERGYSKFVIVLPSELVEQSGLKEGDELEGNAEHHRLILKKSEKTV